VCGVVVVGGGGRGGGLEVPRKCRFKSYTAAADGKLGLARPSFGVHPTSCLRTQRFETLYLRRAAQRLWFRAGLIVTL
jgi:hypothetical protein